MEKKDRNKTEKEKISRKDFLKLGFGFVLGGIATGLLGCKDQAFPDRAGVPMPQYGNFIASPKTKVYHKPNCRLAPAKDIAVYFDSPTGAEYNGFRPCYICKPEKP